MTNDRSRRVYSTDGERIVSERPAARPRQSGKRQPSPSRSTPPADGVVRVQRESKGRRGKTVTVVSGLPGGPAELDQTLKVLKQHCGAGGTREGALLEIQGDHRERLRTKLESLGHRVKLAGG